MKSRWSPQIVGLILLIVIVVMVSFGPSERTLGRNVRLVYLHGAWVWTALIGFIAAGAAGLVGIVLRQRRIQRWSAALGITALFFWITYLPLSLWTMQANWNGIFLEEPRWRLALVFGITGILMQTGARIINRLPLTSALNTGYILVLGWALANTDEVMHPSSPIFSSDAVGIQYFFLALVIVCLLTGWQLARALLPKQTT